MKHGKKYRTVAEKVNLDKIYDLEEAIKLIKENKIAKFDETVEVHIKSNINPKKGDQQLRGTVSLPYGTGKTKKIAVITTTHTKEAKESGADIIGGEEIVEKIKNGKFFEDKIPVDVLVATPEMMSKLASVAKIIGPKGLMPSPKAETVTTKIKETVEALKKGKAAFKNDNSGNVHQAVGKISFSEEKLIENIKIFVEGIEKAKPESLKGKLIANISICSTMGVGIKIKL